MLSSVKYRTYKSATLTDLFVVHFWVLRFCPPFSCPAFSIPINSSPAISSCLHLSWIFRSTYFIPLFHFCPLFFQSCIFSRPCSGFIVSLTESSSVSTLSLIVPLSVNVSYAYFYPRDAMLARSLRQQRVCPSVRHTPVLCLAERKEDREMYTV